MSRPADLPEEILDQLSISTMPFVVEVTDGNDADSHREDPP